MAQQLRIDVRLPHGHWAGDVTRQHPSATLRIEQHMPLSRGRGTARCWSNEDLHATVLNHNGIDTCTDPEDGRLDGGGESRNHASPRESVLNRRDTSPLALLQKLRSPFAHAAPARGV